MPTDEELIKSKIGLDTTDAKTAVRELNQGIRVLETGFRASAAGLGDWANSANGLEMRAKSLNGQIELQGRKVGALTDEYKRVAKEKGDTSKAALDLQIKINKETESLNKMQGELTQTNTALNGLQSESKQSGTAIEKLDKEQKKAATSADNLKNKSGGLSKGLATVGKAALAAAAAVGAMVLGVARLVTGQAAAADDLVDLSTKTDISVERLQELSYIGKQTGTDLDVMTGSLSKLIKNMGTVGKGGAAADAFKELGVSVTDAQGNLRDSEAVFNDSLAALGKVENETQRDVLAMAIFGKSAQELNPLIETSADEMARLSKQAHDVGAVMKEDDVRALASFQDGLDSLKDGLKGTAGTLVSTFMPGLQGLIGAAQGYLTQFTGIVASSGGDIGKAAGGIGGLIGQIIADVAKKAPEMVTAGLALIQGLMEAVIAAIPALVPAVIQIVMSLAQFILQNIPMLITAGVQILLALITGLTTALPQLITMIVAIIPQVVTALIGALPLLIPAALELILALANGIIAAIPILIPYIPQIITAVFNALIEALPLIGEAAVKLILALVKGIVDNLPMIVTAAGNIITSLVTGVTDLWETIKGVGQSIIDGVWEGIQATWTTLTTNIGTLFGGLVDFIKGLLGIASPSKVFGGIGKNMALGLGTGWADQFKKFASKVGADLNGLNGPTLALNAAGGGGRGGLVIEKLEVIGRVDSGISIRKLARQVVEEIQRNQ